MPEGTQITIKSGTTTIAENAFYNCQGLIAVAFPSSVTSIGSSAFSGCSGLTSVTIEEGVTSIGSSAFYGCSGLTSVTIPSGVTSISDYAFSGCSSLTSVTIPSSVTSIGGGAFSGCRGLTSVTIPSGVTSIGGGAFSGCRGLTSVTIPSGVTSIGNSTFSGCSGLTSVTIPSSVTSIGSSAFYGCSGLTSVTIPSSVTSIGSSAFRDCSGLTSVTIPSSVTSIGGSVFDGCSALISVTVMREKPISISSTTFTNRANATLHVPYGCKDAYESANYWKEFKKIVDKDEDNYIMPAVSIACKGGQATLPISMNNVEQIVGFQFDLQLPEGVTLATNANGTMAATLTDRASEHSLSVSKVGDGLYRFISVSMNNNAFAGNEGALLNVKLLVDESVALGDYEVKVTNTELTASDQTEIHSVDGMATLTVRKAEPGDVNGDGKLSVSDVASIIGYVLNDRPAIFIESAADLNGSNTISVTDAVIVIDKILNANTPAGARRTEEPENEPQ